MKTKLSQKIVTAARSWLGTRYHHQGRLKKTSKHKGGVDCVGLVMGVVAELNITGAGGKNLIELDRTDYSAHPDGRSLVEFLDMHLQKTNLKKIKDGDILLFKLFKHPQHVGIATLGKIRGLGVIHCYSASGSVVEHILSPAWLRMIVGVYRFKLDK
ncbi:MAG: hypothetical protein COA94_00990 [Rickettsiales bacterium]|nr:MAG: hypothetical protein COA94_00990 [Rickettsiales bacterium]